MRTNLFRMMTLMVAGFLLLGLIPAYGDEPPDPPEGPPEGEEEPDEPPAQPDPLVDQHQWVAVADGDWGADPVLWDRYAWAWTEHEWTWEWTEYNETTEEWEGEWSGEWTGGEYQLADSPADNPPGAGDWAIFERGVATATTTKLDGTLNREVDGLRVGVDRVILDLNGNDLDVGDLGVGRDSENNRVVGSLTVEGTGTLTAGALSFPAAGGLLTVTGSGTEVYVTSRTDRGDQPRLRVTEGALLSLYGEEFSGEDILVDNARLNFTAGGRDLFFALGSGATTGVTVRNGGLIDARNRNIEAGRQTSTSFTVNNAAFYSAILRPGHRTTTTTIDIEDGGVWRASALQQIYRQGTWRSRNPRVHITVGGHAPGEPGSPSRLLVTGNADIGQDKDTDDPDVGGDYRSEEAYLDLNEAGQMSVGGYVRFHFSARLTIDGGTLEATSMNVEEGKSEVVDEETITSNAEYVITLNQSMVGAEAPLRILKEVGIPEINEQDELGDDVIYEGTGDVALGYGQMRLTLVLGEDEELPGIPFVPQIGQSFNLLRYEGALTGHFLDLAPNSTVVFSEHGYDFELDYGSGNDSAITLTVIPEPQTLGLLLAAGALLALRRRGKR